MTVIPFPKTPAARAKAAADPEPPRDKRELRDDEIPAALDMIEAALGGKPAPKALPRDDV